MCESPPSAELDLSVMSRRFRVGPFVGMLLVLGLVGAGCGRTATLLSDGRSQNDSAPQIVIADAGAVADVAVADVSPLTVSCFATCRGVDKPVGMSPYSIRFRFRNSGAAPVFLRAGCILEYRISSCERCYENDFGPRFQCGSCICGDKTCTPNGVACGACEPERGVAVPPGGMVENTWTGESEDAARNCRVPLPAAAYGLAIRVYETAADAVKRNNPREVLANFLLGPTATPFDLDLAAK